MKNLSGKVPKITFFVGLGVVTILTIAGVLASIFLKPETVDPNVIVRVGSENITKQDLNEKYFGISLSGDIDDENLGETLEIDEEQRNYFIDLLVEESILRQTAEENGILVTDKEVEEKSSSEIVSWNLLTEQQKEVASKQVKMNILRERTREKVVTWKKGRHIEIRFDKHFAIADSLTDIEKAEKEKTQAQDIIADREYADNLKSELYNNLQNGSLTFDEAMDQMMNDEFIDHKNWDFTVRDPAITFDTLNSPEGGNLLKKAGFDEALKNTAKGKISEPFLVKLDYGDWNNNETDFKDSKWVILIVDDEYDGEATDMNSWFSTKKMEFGVKSYIDGYNSVKKSASANVAHAWNSTACTSGRYNQGVSHPGDLISEIRMFTAAGANVAVGGSYSYVRNQDSRAYAYTGCPLLGGYTVGNYSGFSASEASQSNGCMYRFASVYAATVNLCCGGYHNPHGWKVGKAGTLENKGYWYIRYTGTSFGSAWYGPFSGEFAAGYGARYSDPYGDGVNLTIYNGDTVYLRAYWKVDPNIAPVAYRVSSTYGADSDNNYNIPVGSTTIPITLSGKFTDADNDMGTIQIMYKKTTDSTWKSFGTSNGAQDPTGSYSATANDVTTGVNVWGWKDPFSSSGPTITFPNVNLGEGSYTWAVRAIDEHSLYGDSWSSQGSFSIIMPIYSLNVTKIGTGTGTVAGSGISCGTDCLESYAYGTSVTLTATPSANSTFAGWSGACTGTGTCTVSMTTSRSVTASFSAVPTLSVSTLSCSVSPQAGLAPLVVKVSTFSENLSPATFDYDMDNDGTYEYSGRPGEVYYTYSSGGKYIIKVRHILGLTATCSPNPITVTNPSDSSGGEVAP